MKRQLLYLIFAIILILTGCSTSKKTGEFRDVARDNSIEKEKQTYNNVDNQKSEQKASEKIEQGKANGEVNDLTIEESALPESVNKDKTRMTIYDIEDGYIEVDYNPNLPHHSYDWSNLENINGYKYYKAEDGRISTFGIDVSKYQGEINWDLVKGSGVEFVIIRMGYRGYGNGQLVVDEMFHENISAALNAGLGVGVYIFSQAISEEEAIEEAEFVVQNIRDYEITYPVVFDTEEIKYDDARTDDLSIDKLTDITIAFCEKLKQLGHEPYIYANGKWLTTKLNLELLTEYNLWYADYQERPLYPYEFKMWQYSEKGTIPGIKGPVDLNIFFND